jgi:hypothetical protein
MTQRFLIIAGLASVLASGFPSPGAGHDWYMGLTNSAGVACCGSAECRPAAARYNLRTGSWETEVIKDTWLPVPPGAMAPIPSPDGNYHVCEYAGTIRCFFQPGQSNAIRSRVRSSLTWLRADRVSSIHRCTGPRGPCSV